MAAAQTSRFFTLLQREFREYRNSLLWTPVIIAVVLGTLMLASVVLVNRVGFFSDLLLRAISEQEDTRAVSISISMTDDAAVPFEFTTSNPNRDGDSSLTLPLPGELDDADRVFEVIPEPNAPADAWEFSREWSFNPNGNGDDDRDTGRDLSGRELNPMLSVVHGILLLILLITSANYLLGSLYDDRKDRSILFWRSMPVSEWEVVLSKFVVALALAPLLYIVVSLLLQLAYVLLLMVLVWRMDRDPFEVVIANLDFATLMTDPISGWLLTALWIAPAYAWLLLASAAARRSPFMVAVLPVVAIAVAEGVILGSMHVLGAVQNHLPHATESSAVGFYLFGPDWTGIDLLSMASGLVFTGLALAGAVWLRRNRWEL